LCFFRLACSPNNPFLDSDYQQCLLNPGCYFDWDLFVYRQYAGQAILPGVPVCYAAILNPAFHSAARQFLYQVSVDT